MFFSFPLYPRGGGHAQAHTATGKRPISHTALQPSGCSPWSRVSKEALETRGAVRAQAEPPTSDLPEPQCPQL